MSTTSLYAVDGIPPTNMARKIRVRIESVLEPQAVSKSARHFPRGFRQRDAHTHSEQLAE